MHQVALMGYNVLFRKLPLSNVELDIEKQQNGALRRRLV